MAKQTTPAEAQAAAIRERPRPGLVAALEAEKAGYEARGLDDRAGQVAAAIAAATGKRVRKANTPDVPKVD